MLHAFFPDYFADGRVRTLEAQPVVNGPWRDQGRAYARGAHEARRDERLCAGATVRPVRRSSCAGLTGSTWRLERDSVL